jgi:2-dehydro-3-deoxyphosphogluconate aldolase/(4S)-4-hydroxy-2-oxoglutarate aldolase
VPTQLANVDAPFDIIAAHRLVPVIALRRDDWADPLASALVAGGLPIAEVTFRTAAAPATIRKMASRKELLVGAGTVLTVEQVDEAHQAGARFVVTPGFDSAVVDRCLALNLPICPGVCTPSDISQALGVGLRLVKFFPAEAIGGVKTLRAIAAPFGMMRFVPTGGIGPGNLAEYLAVPQVAACGGSWMVKPSLYAGGDFRAVEEATREAVRLAKSSDT